MNLYRNRFVGWFVWRFIIKQPRLRLALTKLLVSEREAEIELFGSRLVVNTISEIGYSNAVKNAAGSAVIRDEVGSLVNLALLLEPGDTFIDIGANVGLYSSVLGRMKYVFPQNPYYAFEANPGTYARLIKTVEDKAVTARQLALSNKPGILSFTSGATSGDFHAVSADADNQTSIDVTCERLDSLSLEGGSLVMKIDVEGHEWPVLQGAEGFFKQNRVKAVYLDGYEAPEIDPWLTGFGFVAFDGRTLGRALEQKFSVLWIHDSWLQKHGYLKDKE